MFGKAYLDSQDAQAAREKIKAAINAALADVEDDAMRLMVRREFEGGNIHPLQAYAMQNQVAASVDAYNRQRPAERAYGGFFGPW
jgi:hypothetical protein